MACGDFNNLPKITAVDKVLRDKAININQLHKPFIRKFEKWKVP